MALVLSGFPGVGKSYVYEKYKFNSDRIILDSDSSKFDKSKFPANYIEHIKENLDKVSIIMVSSHKEVRDALLDAGIDFIVVYPDKSLKEDYLKRYKERGNAQAFIDLIDRMWDTWIDEIEDDKRLRSYTIVRPDVFMDTILETAEKAYNAVK